MDIGNRGALVEDGWNCTSENKNVATVIYNIENDTNAITQSKPLMLINVAKNGNVFTSVIDTGAQHGLIDLNVLHILNLKYDTSDGMHIQGIGDNKIEILGTVELGLSIHGIECQSTIFNVVRETPYSVVLGMNFFIANRMIIDISRKRFIRSMTTEPLCIYIWMEGESSVSVLFKRCLVFLRIR